MLILSAVTLTRLASQVKGQTQESGSVNVCYSVTLTLVKLVAH